MTRRRWIADQVHGDRAALLGSNAAHLARVLRARVGQQFEISTGDRVRLGRVLAVTEQRVDFELGEDVGGASSADPGGESSADRDALAVTLYLAVFKFDRMEWAIEKATELGVEEIVPVIARRTDSHLAKAAGKRVERWRRLVHEAAQQSRRASAPQIADPLALRELLAARTPVWPGSSTRVLGSETRATQPNHVAQPPSAPTDDVAPTSRRRDLSYDQNVAPTSRRRALEGKQEDVARPPSAGLRIVLAETERGSTLTQLLKEIHPDPERSEGEGPALSATQISLAVGPEGGWTSDELASFDRAGWQRASLGPRILRAETAAIAALAIATLTPDS